MRISVDERDRGFAKLQEWGGPHRGIKISLNGEELRGVITADEEMGEVLVMLYEDDSGPMPRLKVDGGRVCQEWRRGKVEIVMPRRDAE